MPPHPIRRRTGLLLVLAGTLLAACAPKYVIVPDQGDRYSSRDTLYGRLQGKEIRVTFHYDTTWRTDTVTRWRTIHREGNRVDTVVVVEARRPPEPPRIGIGGRRTDARVDTVLVVVHDTVRVLDPRRPGQRVDTVRIVVRDTVRVADPRRPGGMGGTGGPVVMPPRPDLGHVDTIRIVVHDTIRVTHRDTVRVVVHDTVRVGTGGGNGEGDNGGNGGGRGRGPRTTVIPPGQYPPRGQCRLWIVGTPPGRQAHPAACAALGTIPSGAFVLFNNKAWDMDYDWSADSTAPPEIAAISRRRFH